MSYLYLFGFRIASVSFALLESSKIWKGNLKHYEKTLII